MCILTVEYFFQIRNNLNNQRTSLFKYLKAMGKENDAKIARENKKTPNREICRSGRSFSIAFKHHVNKNIYEIKQPSGQSISYPAENESYQKQSKQKAMMNAKCNCRVSCTFK